MYLVFSLFFVATFSRPPNYISYFALILLEFYLNLSRFNLFGHIRISDLPIYLYFDIIYTLSRFQSVNLALIH